MRSLMILDVDASLLLPKMKMDLGVCCSACISEEMIRRNILECKDFTFSDANNALGL